MTSIDGYLWTAMLAAALSLRGNYLYVTNITLRRRDGKKKGGKPESLVCELNGNTQTHTSSVWVIARYRTANVQQFSLSGADKCLSEHTIKQPPLPVRNCLIWLRYKCLSLVQFAFFLGSSLTLSWELQHQVTEWDIPLPLVNMWIRTLLETSGTM